MALRPPSLNARCISKMVSLFSALRAASGEPPGFHGVAVQSWIDLCGRLRIHAARVDHCGTIAVSRMMVAEIYSKLPHYIERALISLQQVPTVQLPLTE